MAELTHFRLIFVFQNPGKHRKISDFLVFRRYRKEKWLLILIINFDSFKCFNPMFVFLTTKGYFTSFHIIYLTKSNYLCECLVFFCFFFLFLLLFFLQLQDFEKVFGIRGPLHGCSCRSPLLLLNSFNWKNDINNLKPASLLYL